MSLHLSRRGGTAGSVRGKGRWGRRLARGAALGFGLVAVAWAAAAGCGARSELWSGQVAGDDDAGAAVDAGPDVLPTNAFCGESTYDSGPTELSMFVLLDRSGSMQDDNRWGHVTAALSAFATSPQAAGLGMGLQFYPVKDSCAPEDYAVPAVPIGKLPGATVAITNALQSTSTYGETPTLPALKGGVYYARSVAIANPEERVVIALVTDGAPNACDSSAAKVAEAEQEALASDPKILTYVIGLATGYTDEIALMAAAGGTGKPILVDDGAQAAQKIVDAMTEVKIAQESCVFGVPIPAGATVLATDLSARYRTAPGATPVELPIVASLGSCSGEGFFPDNLDAPGTITLCPAACAAVHGAAKSTVTVTAGCGMGTDGGIPDAASDAPGCGSSVDFSCVSACGATDFTPPVCDGSQWVCANGTVSTKKCECPDIPHVCCKGEYDLEDASCVNGAWTCPPGEPLYGQAGCTPPDMCTSSLPCGFGTVCDFPDDQCGASIYHGKCVPPGDCNLGDPAVCGCDKHVYPSRCDALAAGVDVDQDSKCITPVGMIKCGGYYCKSGMQICRHSKDITKSFQDSYACLDLPPGCANGCVCPLCDVCPISGPCESCPDNAHLECAGVPK
ncbi:MAG: vWA domain-containing protein [Polyangiaceae bacterium]